MKIKISKMLYRILTEKGGDIPCSKQILAGAKNGTIRLGNSMQLKIKDIYYNHRKNTLCSMLEDDGSCYDWSYKDLLSFDPQDSNNPDKFKNELFIGAKPYIRVLRTLPEMLTIKGKIPIQIPTSEDAPIQRVLRMTNRQFQDEIKFIHSQLHGIAIVCYNDWGEIVGFCIVYPNALVYANDSEDGKAIIKGDSKKYNGLPVTLVDKRLTGERLGTVERLLNTYTARHYKRMISISEYEKLTAWFSYAYENTNQNTNHLTLSGQNVLLKLDLSGDVDRNDVHHKDLCSLQHLYFRRLTNTGYLSFHAIQSTDAIAPQFTLMTSAGLICPICGKIRHTNRNSRYYPCDACMKKLYNNTRLLQCTDKFKVTEDGSERICYPATMLDKNGKLTRRASVIKKMLKLL